jgi:hypothetical protein
LKKHLRRIAMLAVLGLVAGLLGLVGASAPAGAVSQTGGHDLRGWAPNWNWTYNRTFKVHDATGDDITVNESVKYTNGGVTTFAGQLAYQLNMTGTVTGGSGSANANGTSVSLSSFAGTVSGEQFVRVSDLATLRDHEVQQFTAKAAGLVSVSATVETILDSSPAERGTLFRLHNGDAWSFSYDQTQSGSFVYDAGSFGSGSSPIGSTSTFAGTATVTSTTISPPIQSNLAVDFVHNASSDGNTIDDQYWSDTYDNVAQQHTFSQSSDGTQLTLDRSLTAASIGSTASTISESLSSNLTCAGAPITVSGTLSSGAANAPVTVFLDESPVVAGQAITVNTLTGAGGTYSAVINAPAIPDGANKDQARGSWGIVARSGTTSTVNAATLVVTPQDCGALAYTGSTTAQLGASAPVSATLTDQATGAGVPGAVVTFSLSGQPGTATATTNGSGVASTTLPITGTPRAATLTATSPSSASLTAASTTAGFTVTKDPTTVTVSSSEPSATVGDPITFTATVAPNGPSLAVVPSGTVQFTVDGSPLGGPVALDGTGSAQSISINSLNIGTHDVQASYVGDTLYGSSTSDVFHQVVHKVLIPTAVAVTSSQNPTVFGQSTTLTATVTAADGGAPTGGVLFKEGSTTLGGGTLSGVVGNDTATLDLSTLPVGVHHVFAVYGADEDYAPNSSPAIDQTVLQAQTQTSITPSVASPVAGQPLSFTINVDPVAPGAGTPTGTVQLTVDGTNTGSPAPVSGGVATVNVTSLNAGAHTIGATYSGDSSFASSNTSIPLSVAKADTQTTLVITPNPSVDDQAVTLTATVVPVLGVGTPTGTVTFKEGSTSLGAGTLHATTSGVQASIGLSNLSVGSHVITAVYGGDANDNPSTSDPVTQVVNEAPPIISTALALTASANPSVYGQPVTFTATVTAEDGSTPTGAVQFSVDGTDLGSPVTLDSSGVATSPAIASLAAGGHTVVASYGGDLGFAESSQVRPQTVKQATTTASIAGSANPAPWGQAITFTATLTPVSPGAGTPGGSVQFLVDGNALGSPVATSGGQATSSAVNGLDPGHHTIAIVTTGDPNFKATTASLDEVVNTIPTSTSVSATPNPATFGQAVTLTATVTASGTGTPSGTVTFRDGTTVLGTTAVATVGSSQQAQLITSSLAAGPHAVTATYNGDTRFSASAASAPVNVVIGQAPTSITATPAVLKVKVGLTGLTLTTDIQLLYPISATLTRTDGTPVAGQTVTFFTQLVTLCTAVTNAQGVATCNPTTVGSLTAMLLDLGYHVSFAGSANYLPTAGSAGLIKVQ